MNKEKKSLLPIFFIFFILLFFMASLNGQWESDLRLTFDINTSRTAYNNAWAVGTSGDTLHVLWYDNRDGNYEIYYKRSTDNGTNWSSDIRLTNNSGQSESPSVSVSNNIIRVVWLDDRDGDDEIYYKCSTNGGTSWGPDTRLTNAPGWAGGPSISVSGTNVHIVWIDYRDGNFEIYYKRSTNGGASWSADTRLTNDPSNSWYPSFSVSGTNVHIVWYENRDGNNEIYYKRSTDNGSTWGPDIRLTNDPGTSQYPSVFVSGANVHVVWGDSRDGNDEVYYKRSTDNGLSWSVDTRLTNAPDMSWTPSIFALGNILHLVWEDYRDGNWEVYYLSSLNNGLSWEPEIRLTNALNTSRYANVLASGSTVHVVWDDNRDGNYEIYYKRNLTGNPTGIKTTSFSALRESYYIKLQWRVESEDNIIQYLVHKKSITEESNYSEIARIDGSGFSPSPRTYFYRDKDVKQGISYYYKLGVVKLNGNIEWYGPVSAVVTGINRYLKVSPNPCKDKVSIRYCSGQSAEDIELKIYDISGKLVKSFSLTTDHSALPTAVSWDGRDNYGRLLPSGIYICTLEIGENKKTEKILIVR